MGSSIRACLILRVASEGAEFCRLQRQPREPTLQLEVGSAHQKNENCTSEIRPLFLHLCALQPLFLQASDVNLLTALPSLLRVCFPVTELTFMTTSFLNATGKSAGCTAYILVVLSVLSLLRFGARISGVSLLSASQT